MIRIILLIIVTAFAFLVSGCGGSSSSTDNFISIVDFRFQPDNTTVDNNTLVQWVNQGSATHSVVSGTLGPTPFPTGTQITVLPNEFSLETLNLTLGDFVVFVNAGPGPAQVFVQDENDNLVFQSATLNTDETATWHTTDAGQFTVRNSFQPSAEILVDVVGIPHPDGLFDSGIIAPGSKFQFTFTTTGSHSYFCGVHLREEGVVVVQ
jgi:plastocyanin